MKLDKTNISCSLKKQTTLVLVLLMLSLPAISMFSSLLDAHNNYIELHGDKDTGEPEKLEENSKNEKKDLQVTHIEFRNVIDVKTAKSYGLHTLKRDYIREIPIPPPDMV